MSNELETAPVGTPEEETAQTPETPVAETSVSETATPEETSTEAPVTQPEEAPTAEALPADETPADETPAEETVSTEEESTEAAETVERETKAAPNLSELLDDFGDDFEKAIEATVLKFKEGDIVEGSIVSVDAEGAMVDVGYKSEGLIPGRELSIRNNVDPKDVVNVGEVVEAVVLDMEDDEGRMILSKKRAMYERAWGKIQKISDEDGTVEGTVIEVVKGGLIVDIGLRGFLPASLVDLRRVRDLDPFIGDTITAKVIELDRQRNNVVLSRRAHLEDALAEERTEFLDNLAEGEIRDGIISSVVNFGAFVDLGGMDGLVHVSELSWQHVNHPGELVKVGDKVTVKVLEVDRDRERISLSIRQTTEDPWDVFANNNEVGDVVEGKVTKTVPFGAFVSVADGVEGLVHVSEIAMHRVESPELELSIGQTVNVKITEKDDERRRVSLSIKQALPDYKERAEKQEQRKGPRKPREFEREFGAEAEEHPPMPVDASLEAILKELKERGIGRR
ncbi:MAG: 30S ribosomal protein S1 [Actinomycetota bacterium]|nr:30S ribosomal protein S1 [Actinomycetota bacterium]